MTLLPFTERILSCSRMQYAFARVKDPNVSPVARSNA